MDADAETILDGMHELFVALFHSLSALLPAGAKRKISFNKLDVQLLATCASRL
jgi:hypothetical protein